MKKIFTYVCIALAVVLITVTFSRISYFGFSTKYIEYEEPMLEFKFEPTKVNIRYPNDQVEEIRAVFCNGRLCVPVEDTLNNLGAEYFVNEQGYNIQLGERTTTIRNNEIETARPILKLYNGIDYINIYYLLQPFNFTPIIDVTKNEVSIMVNDFNNKSDLEINYNPRLRTAVLRLEDVVADGLDVTDKPKYTVEMVEKLKFLAEYFKANNQKYYIGWIPVYNNPETRHTNDLTRHFNLYNSYFLYVLDYMVDNGGYLGLHGYTHQYGNVRSGDGSEWGSKTPYSYKEQQRRMIKAKQAARKLGYNEDFFEFPHYMATDNQFRMAQQYFDSIHQGYPSDERRNHIISVDEKGKRVYYVPSTADYVRFNADTEVLDRLTTAHRSGYAVSLFYHPTLDNDNIYVESSGNRRIWRLSKNSNINSVFRKVIELGYNFSSYR